MKYAVEKSTPYTAGTKKRILSPAEAARVHGAGFGSGTCTHQMAYKTGNYKKTTVLFITWSEVEYYCPICKERFTNLELF